jgi:hypothetical protein
MMGDPGEGGVGSGDGGGGEGAVVVPCTPNDPNCNVSVTATDPNSCNLSNPICQMLYQQLISSISTYLVSDASTAARQMLRAISCKQKHAHITKRYGVIALLLKLLPRPGR